MRSLVAKVCLTLLQYKTQVGSVGLEEAKMYNRDCLVVLADGILRNDWLASIYKAFMHN